MQEKTIREHFIHRSWTRSSASDLFSYHTTAIVPKRKDHNSRYPPLFTTWGQTGLSELLLSRPNVDLKNWRNMILFKLIITRFILIFTHVYTLICTMLCRPGGCYEYDTVTTVTCDVTIQLAHARILWKKAQEIKLEFPCDLYLSPTAEANAGNCRFAAHIIGILLMISYWFALYFSDVKVDCAV